MYKAPGRTECQRISTYADSYYMEGTMTTSAILCDDWSIAGGVRLAYHRFGPLDVPTDTGSSSSSSSSSSRPSLLLVMGYTGSMYAWPVPMLQVTKGFDLPVQIQIN
jgi:hypothetical protein